MELLKSCQKCLGILVLRAVGATPVQGLLDVSPVIIQKALSIVSNWMIASATAVYQQP